MDLDIISKSDIKRRDYWIYEIARLSGDFGTDTNRLEKELDREIERDGVSAVSSHLRLCGAIPEWYDHDSSEEKQYSKYTDILISKSFSFLGIRSTVLQERADAADVECVTPDYSFVADAKAFRLSRTAKNQKDFKVQAMDTWKRGKPYAMLVCPIYQLPSRSSQIYQQAASRNVCIFSYSHLAVLVWFSTVQFKESAQRLLKEVFLTIEGLNPSKDSNAYWKALNRSILGFSDEISELWKLEKLASVDSIKIAKEESLSYMASEREKIMKYSREQDIKELLLANKIDNKIKTIEKVTDNGLLSVI